MKILFYILCATLVFTFHLHAQIFEFPPSQTWRLTIISQSGGFEEISAVSIDPAGNIYLADRRKNMIFRINREGMLDYSIGGYGWGNNEFDRPMDVWAENGVDVYVADYGNHRIQRFDRRLSYVSTLETRTTGFDIERFGYPVAVSVSRQGDLLVVDEENQRIITFSSFDSHLRTFGGIDAGRFRIGNPKRLHVLQNDMILVRDGSRLLMFDQFGNPYRELPLIDFPAFKDYAVSGSDMFFLREESIDIYRGELYNPFERIMLYEYIADPSVLTRIAVNRNRLVLTGDDQVWMFRLLR